MDKNDVEMKDVIKEPQDLENGGDKSQNDTVDGKVEAAAELNKPTEVGEEELKKGKSGNTKGQNSAQCEQEEALKITESEAEDPNNVTSEGVKEAEYPNSVRSGEGKEAKNTNVVKSDGEKEAEGTNNVKSEGVKEAEDVNNETSEMSGEGEDQHNITSEAEDGAKIRSEADGENACENDEQDGLSTENIVEDQKHGVNAVSDKNHSQQGQHPVQLTASDAPQNETGAADEVHQSKDEAMAEAPHQTDNKEMVDEPKESENCTASGTAVTEGDAEMVTEETKTELNNTDHNVNEEMVNVVKDPENKTVPVNAVADGNAEMRTTPVAKGEFGGTLVANHHEPTTPTALVKCSTANAGNHSGETYKNTFNEPKMGGDEDGTPEEQAAFMRELESFYRERALEFKPPRFYGQQLNCLKLWRAVIRLGGYDRVTGSKLWRQVGESFHPPKTCTTVSWTFRIFYEKALLEYERYKRESGELPLPLALPDPSSVDSEGNGYQASGSGRARRDAAARAMQGWHSQRLFGSSEVAEPAVKDKNLNSMPKREKNLKSIGSLKQKRPNEVEHPVKAARTETSKQLVASVVDVGPPADWVKINVRETKDCFEVYALVPGLLREEVRVQSDPAGRLVITGQPEQPDNPWGITAFKKVVSLPGRIDPLQTSAVVSLHGRLFVRVPFEQANS